MAQNIRPLLAKRLRYLRQKKNLTQESLSNRSGVSLKYVQNLEGKTPYNPTLETLQKLADGFEIPLWKLLRFEE
ncbi:MAG: helix-turn-helix transcriptional regulator [Candidatus Peribacteraceae bacterium]